MLQRCNEQQTHNGHKNKTRKITYSASAVLPTDSTTSSNKNAIENTLIYKCMKFAVSDLEEKTMQKTCTVELILTQ